MKKAEAPDKIFLEWYRIGDERYRDWCITPKTNTESVEYTRTNVFIEKAYEFFSEHLCEYIDVKNANCDTFVNVDDDRFKEDFKNYMEGE